MTARQDRDVEMDGAGSHDSRKTEDESHQNSACQCRLKKLHEAFHVSCTFSNAFESRQVHLSSLAMAAASLKRGRAGKELRRRLGAACQRDLLTNSGSADGRGSTSSGDDANADSRRAVPRTNLQR